eukprot:CAMPEP_0206539918 /NCGR_PEP_ID=MMETSP0325_2-20121206/8692_1 /ASSEMBLY_ACC=CAM_ASM_000347 /TAXON_ID=2866 /ORGANISM="Crypthecodinium cohnii, Strain Seligo" /LENGTH=476 /DNA_ID=CAMNT_0054037535 /DNA_START=38 /DNA_END=1469 /DNA_ORIENTATION=+
MRPAGGVRHSAKASWPPPGSTVGGAPTSQALYPPVTLAPPTSRSPSPSPTPTPSLSPSSALALSAVAPVHPPSPRMFKGRPHPQQASIAPASRAQPTLQIAAKAGRPEAQKLMRYEEEAPVAVRYAEQAMVDPVMREALKRQAVVIGGHAVDAAKYCGKKGLLAFQDYVQQGPKGVSVLCFAGGLATSILGGMSVCNFFGTVMDPFHYILNAYVLVFGLVSTCLEADTDRIGTLMSPFDRLAEPVTRAQAWLHSECRLLTRLRGRGFFYLYQGTLMVTQCVFCLLFLCGLYLVAMGLVCIMMSCGFTPDFEALLSESGAPYKLVEEGGAGVAYASPTGVAFEEQWLRAEVAWRKNKEQLPGKTCRELWALHRQATSGDCDQPKPDGVFNGSAKEQWRLWSALEGLPVEEAKAMFIDGCGEMGSTSESLADLDLVKGLRWPSDGVSNEKPGQTLRLQCGSTLVIQVLALHPSSQKLL